MPERVQPCSTRNTWHMRPLLQCIDGSLSLGTLRTMDLGSGRPSRTNGSAPVPLHSQIRTISTTASSVKIPLLNDTDAGYLPRYVALDSLRGVIVHQNTLRSPSEEPPPTLLSETISKLASCVGRTRSRGRDPHRHCWLHRFAQLTMVVSIERTVSRRL